MTNKNKNCKMTTVKKMSSRICLYLILFTTMLVSVYSVAAAQSAVDLGAAGNFIILSKAGISTTGTTSITGNIGTSPIDSTAITGFGLTVDSSNEFATSPLVAGKVYAADYAPPTPTTMTSAISDMETAYTDAAGRTLPDYTELGAGNIGGMTLTPGLYKWGTDLTIPTDVTLSGGANDVWIFQIAENLDISSATKIILSGGAQAKNIFWQVGGQTTLGTTSVFNGNILSKTLIEINTGATLNGRALAQTAVTLDANTVKLPGVSSSPSEISTPSSPTNNGNSEGSDSEEDILIDRSNGGLINRFNDGNNGNNLGYDEAGNPIGNPVNTPNQKRIEKVIDGISKTITKNGERIEITSVNGMAKLRSDNTMVETKLPTEFEGNLIRVTKSNGVKSEVKIMPIVASKTAIERLELKFCADENNCVITLKEVGKGLETKVVYHMNAQKDGKAIGLFKVKMNVETDVDAETGKVIDTNKPWWAFLASEKKN